MDTNLKCYGNINNFFYFEFLGFFVGDVRGCVLKNQGVGWLTPFSFGDPPCFPWAVAGGAGRLAAVPWCVPSGCLGSFLVAVLWRGAWSPSLFALFGGCHARFLPFLGGCS